jgi:glucose/mannose transport system substrate-binding protein
MSDAGPAGTSRPTWMQSEVAPDVRLRGLVEAYQAPLGRYLSRLGVPAAEVDDAIQEVLIVAASKLSRVQAGSERAFLFETAVRVASNHRRGLRRRDGLSTSLREAGHDHSPTAEDLTIQLLGRAWLDDALEHMPPDVQIVFLLVEIEGMPAPSVAQRLALPEGTVASRLRRAREYMDEWCRRMRASVQGASPVPMHATGPHAVDGGSNAAEIFSWWVQRGEADALRAILGVYERSHPRHGSITSTTVEGNARARVELSSRMLHGRPPDTFQVNGGNALLSWVRRTAAGEQMDTIDFLFDSEGWTSAFPPDVLDLVSHRGRLYAVPLNLHRTNSLFYNQRVLAENGLRPPSTLEELHSVAEILRGRGVVPLAMGYAQPWTLTMLTFEAVLVADAGADYYREFFAGRRTANDSELRRALSHVARMLAYSNEDAARVGWDGALDRMRSGAAAMTIMGDWAKGYLVTKGCRMGKDFGQAPSPGCARAFVFATDVFGLPKRAAHRAGAIELLKVFGSKEGQQAFSQLKGSIPARADVDVSSYDPSARASARDFLTGPRVPSMTSIVPNTFSRALDAAMGAFARGRDPDVVIATVRAHYDLLRM